MPQILGKAAGLLSVLLISLISFSLPAMCNNLVDQCSGSLGPCRQYLELRPQNSNEFSRRHIRDADGQEKEIQISYRNGDKARVLYRKDGSAISYQSWFANGKIKKTAHFDDTGTIVISGSEVRADGSLLWQTVRTGLALLQTTSYYRDGSVFVKTTLNQSSQSGLTQVFHSNGKAWMEFQLSENAFGFDLFRRWTVDGKLEQTGSVVPDSEGRTIFFLRFYHANEKLKAIQWIYRQHSSGPLLEHGKPTKNIKIQARRIEIYGEDGTKLNTIIYQLNNPQHVPERVDVHNPDGSQLSKYFSETGVLRYLQETNADGSYNWRSYPRATDKSEDYPRDYQVFTNPLVDALKTWRDQENQD